MLLGLKTLALFITHIHLTDITNQATLGKGRKIKKLFNM